MKIGKIVGYLLFSASILIIASWIIVETPVQAQTIVYDFYVYLPQVLQSYDPSWVWGEIVTPTLAPLPSANTNPLMSIDHQGRVHLIWDTTSYNVPKFIYHTYLADSGWTTPTAIAESLGTSYTLFPPVVAPDGTLHLLWRNRETTSDPYRTLYAAFRNNAWSADDEVFRSPTVGTTLQGMVHLDQAGNVHATMVDSNFFTSATYHTTHGTNKWNTPIELPHPTYLSWVWPDQLGGVRFYGNDYETPPNLYYSYWRNDEFSVFDLKGPESVTVLSGRKTQLDGLNNLHIYWSERVAIPGGEVNGLYQQCMNTDLRVTKASLLTGQESVYISDVVKAASFERRFALAWPQDSGKSIKLMIWDGCTLTDIKTVPFPTEATWSVKALAVSNVPGKVCLLGYSINYFPDRYRVLCADILR